MPASAARFAAFPLTLEEFARQPDTFPMSKEIVPVPSSSIRPVILVAVVAISAQALVAATAVGAAAFLTWRRSRA